MTTVLRSPIGHHFRVSPSADKFKSLTLKIENDGQVQELEKKEACAVRLSMFESIFTIFFRNFNIYIIYYIYIYIYL